MDQRKARYAKPIERGGGRSGRNSAKKRDSDRVQLYGYHAVEAALANEKRPVYGIQATENAARKLAPLIAKRGLGLERVLPKALDRQLGADTVHQGVLLDAGPLDSPRLADLDLTGTILVLDQVTDPHNVGAALRSAAAFGAKGLVMTRRHSPPLGGVLAKAASGALDLIPIVLVRNLAESLTELGDLGVTRLGMAEDTESALEDLHLKCPLALVLGAEGRGLRQLTRDRCDMLCRISTASKLASLNVSNAAAIALHWARVKAQ